MRVTFLDFVLCGLVIPSLILMTVLTTYYAVLPLSAHLGDYHVLGDAGGFLLIYGLMTGIFIHLLMLFHPLPSGLFPMESWAFTQFKLLAMVGDTGMWAVRPFRFMALIPVFLTLFGARVGRNLGSAGEFADPYMVRIGRNVVIGVGSKLCGNATHENKIRLGYVHIGNNVTIGMNCIILPNVTIGDGATILIGSVVMPDTVIPPGETWRGNPARKWD